MRDILRIQYFFLTAAPWAMVRGAALSVVVLLMGTALLGLSGWFITATGLAGLAGIGIAFDFFRPSAGVRFLALGRAAARYGERLLTHDATLRVLAKLRVRLLRARARGSARALGSLRSEAVLTKIVADVDALDGIVLRLLLPGLAAVITQLVVFFALGWLVGWLVACVVFCFYMLFAALILWRLGRRGLVHAEVTETQTQALRRGLIDMIRDREALILDGRIGTREEALLALDSDSRDAAAALDRAERNAGFFLSGLVAVVAGLALMAGAWLVNEGVTDPSRAAIGVFVALALAETLLPLRRGFAELGRMIGAARRIGAFDPPSEDRRDPSRVHLTSSDIVSANQPVLSIETGAIALDLNAGEAAAMIGPSGAGKTTLLLRIAGLMESHEQAEGGIRVLGRSPLDWEEEILRELVTLVPQRSALLRGTIRDNLMLAAPAADAEIWNALEAVDLDKTIRERGGLEARLDEGGAGFSGGQTHRLALARALLRRPRLLLLDEPTVGLDEATADRVLTGIRRALPDTAILAALHRGAEHVVFGQSTTLILQP